MLTTRVIVIAAMVAIIAMTITIVVVTRTTAVSVATVAMVANDAAAQGESGKQNQCDKQRTFHQNLFRSRLIALDVTYACVNQCGMKRRKRCSGFSRAGRAPATQAPAGR